MLLTADLGSDGYSTFVNGLALTLDVSFWVVNLAVGRGPGAGRLRAASGPGSARSPRSCWSAWSSRCCWTGGAPRTAWSAGRLCWCWPSRCSPLGIAAYLGSNTGAGPAEAAGLAWDPPVPFKWSYSLVQGGGALGGFLLGATVGVGTIAVIVALGPLVDLTSRLMRLDVHQT